MEQISHKNMSSSKVGVLTGQMEDCYKLHSRKCLNQVIFLHRAAQAFLEENWDSSTETSFSKPEVYIYLGYQFTLLEFHLNIQWKYVMKSKQKLMETQPL